MIIPRPTLYRDAALADPSGPSLRKGVSLLGDAGHVVWIRPSTDEGDLPPNVRVIDAGGPTLVPGTGDSPTHYTLPRRSHSFYRRASAPEDPIHKQCVETELLRRAGARW